MGLQKIIANYLNGENFKWNSYRDISLLQFKNQIIEFTGERKYRTIGESYETAFSSQKTISQIEVCKIKKLIISNNYDDFLKPLIEFQQFINKHFDETELVGAYLHGSLATNDFVKGYSDFDALLILRKGVFESDKYLTKLKKKIRKANSFLYLLDPLQHHNLFIISEYDLNNYYETTFPIILFEHTVEVTNYGNDLKFVCMKDNQNLIDSLSIRQFYFGEMWPKFSKMTCYDLKNAVQNVLILPTLYLQAISGEYGHKKSSFNKAEKDFNMEIWEIVHKASKIRRNCPFRTIYPYWFRKFIGLFFHYRYLNLLHSKFDRNNSDCMLNILGDDYLDKALLLTNKMIKKLNERKDIKLA